MENPLISIGGHTNTGKTTLVRCLLKRDVGLVKDESDVTVKSEYYKGLQATFVDTPGLRHADAILDIYKLTPNFGYFENELLKRGWFLDVEAIKAYKMSDVVYYVVQTDIVPDEGYKSEVHLIKIFCENVIGIINKSDTDVNGRKIKWELFFKENDIKSLSYDFYWDSPLKIQLLFEMTKDKLSVNKKKAFCYGLDLVKKEDEYRRQLIVLEINNAIDKCKLITQTLIGECDRVSGNVLEDNVRVIVNDFVRAIASIYKTLNFKMDVTTSLSTQKFQEILIHREDKKINEAIKDTAIGAGVGGFAALYGAGLFLGPIGWTALAVGAIGGLIGASIPQEDTKRIEISLSESDIFEITKIFLAIIWTISYFGYERRKMNTGQSERIKYLLNNELPEFFQKKGVSVNNYRDMLSDVLVELGV